MENDIHVSMYNLVIAMSSRDKTMTEDEAMLFNQCCATLKAQAELDELVVRHSLEKLKHPPDDNEQGDQVNA